MSNSDKDPSMNQDGNPVSGPKAMSRRSLLKGSVKAMPVVLTLHSGAALAARTSNMISRDASPELVDGKTLCLKTDTYGMKMLEQDLYDLGDPPYAPVYRIPNRDYRVKPNDGADPVPATDICESGQIGYFKPPNGGWEGGNHYVEIKQGMLVSNGALTSFAGATHFIDDL